MLNQSHMIRPRVCRAACFTAAMVISTVTVVPAFAQTAAGIRLPGARPVIDASQFESLQAAFDAVPAAGGVVKIPAGEFEITEPLIVHTGDTRVEGAGSATNIVNRNENGQPAILVQHADGAAVKKADRLWRINLSNFRVTGNPQSGHGIHAILIEEIFVHGVSISYNGGDGLRLDQCYEDPRVADCLFTYNKGVGVFLAGCHDIVVNANHFEENQDALHCIDSFNLCMNGNNLDDHLGRGVLIENTYGSVLSGNMIEECSQAAVTLNRDCYGITISANVIAHNGAGVDLQDAHGCSVSANTFTINKENALRIGADSARITVTGNNFSNSYIGDGQVKRNTDDLLASGLVLDGGADVVVSGNVFSGIRPKAIEQRGASAGQVLVSGNIFIDTTTDAENR